MEMPKTKPPRTRLYSSSSSIDSLWRAIEGLRGDSAVQALAHQRTDKALEDIKRALEGITEAIGATGVDEHGKPIGTGIRGEVMRIGAKVDNLYSIKAGWERYLIGMMMSGSVTFGILWFIIKDKIKKVFA